MSDNRVFVIKNLNRVGLKDAEGKFTGPVREYITADNKPVGVSKEFGEQLAETLGIDPDEAVVPAEDDMVVFLHDSARKLPKGPDVSALQYLEEIRMI